MADRPLARDEDRLPWLEPVGEGKKSRAQRPVSRTALVGLLVAFFGVGLAVAFSLGYRFAMPVAEAPAPKLTSIDTVRVAAKPAVPPEPAPPPAVVEQPAEKIAPPKAMEPAIVKARTAVKPRAKAAAKKIRLAAKKSQRRKPILRPFNLTRRPPPPPSSWQPPPPTPRGRVIQLGAYSTPRQADRAWRSIIWRYPYLATKPKVVAPTRLVGGWRYHRLRLGTETQAQSAVICQYLQARGQSCIVIY